MSEKLEEEQVVKETAQPREKFGETFPVRLVTDFKKSQEYYRDVLGCTISDWGHATRDNMAVILQQAVSPDEVRPNAVSAKRPDYPTEWKGPEHGWDSFVHVEWDDLDRIVEEIRGKGGIIAIEPFNISHGHWDFRNAYIQDPDRYNIVLGGMRERKTHK